MKENTKAPRYWPLCPREPPRKGPVTRKCFHLMSSSWIVQSPLCFVLFWLQLQSVVIPCYSYMHILLINFAGVRVNNTRPWSHWMEPFYNTVFQKKYLTWNIVVLTKWQMTIWSAFSWMKVVDFRIRFHWNVFLGIDNTSTLVQIIACRRIHSKLTLLLRSQVSDTDLTLNSKRNFLPCLYRRDMWCLSWIFGHKWPRYDGIITMRP